jgi:hypothetical protein
MHSCVTKIESSILEIIESNIGKSWPCVHWLDGWERGQSCHSVEGQVLYLQGYVKGLFEKYKEKVI